MWKNVFYFDFSPNVGFYFFVQSFTKCFSFTLLRQQKKRLSIPCLNVLPQVPKILKFFFTNIFSLFTNQNFRIRILMLLIFNTMDCFQMSSIVSPTALWLSTKAAWQSPITTLVMDSIVILPRPFTCEGFPAWWASKSSFICYIWLCLIVSTRSFLLPHLLILSCKA